MNDFRDKFREAYGIVEYRLYSEKQAAHILGKDVGTLKRWRGKGIIPHIRLGDSVKYFGAHLIDVLVNGTRDEGTAEVEIINPKGNSGGAWQSTNNATTGSEITGSADDRKARPTTDAGSTDELSAALRLARQSMKLRSGS